MTQRLYTRIEAAEKLQMCLSSLDVLIGRGEIRVIRRGYRVFLTDSEIDRSRRSFPTIWPPKRNGITVRGYRSGEPRDPRRRMRMEAIDRREESGSRTDEIDLVEKLISREEGGLDA